MNSKKKVLFIANNLSVSGQQRYLASVLNCLDSEKNDVYLYVRRNIGGFVDEINNNVTIILNNGKRTFTKCPLCLLLAFISAVLRFFRCTKAAQRVYDRKNDFVRSKQAKREYGNYLKNYDFDVTVCFAQGYAADILQLVSSKKKYAFWFRSTGEHGRSNEKLLSFADGIITSSNNMKAVLCFLYPEYESRISVIENYIDVDKLNERANRFVPAKYPALQLCTLGRLNSVKGFDLAIKAAAVLADNGIDFEWCFIGDDTQGQDLMSLIKLYNVEDKISVKGKMENPYPYIKLCDIYVQPSREESFGVSIREAQALLKPVVATKTIASIEHIADGLTGLVTEPDEYSLAMGILKYYNDNKLVENIVQNLSFTDFAESKNLFESAWRKISEN